MKYHRVKYSVACNSTCINSEGIKILTACKFLSRAQVTFLSEIPFIHAGPFPTLASPLVVLMLFRVCISMVIYVTSFQALFRFFSEMIVSQAIWDIASRMGYVGGQTRDLSPWTQFISFDKKKLIIQYFQSPE